MKGENFGEVLKKIAKVYGVITVSACIITAMVLYANVADTQHYHSDIEKATFTLWGNILMFGGSIGNLVISLFMYGFGELVSNSKKIADSLTSKEEEPIDELPEI